MEKKIKKSLSEELIRAREQGLDEIKNRGSMKAHGKVHGMDTFSWCAPKFDNLATVIGSFPFPVIWIAKHEQIRCAITYYPEISEHIESVIIYDQANIKFKSPLYDQVENLVGIGSVREAIELIPAIIGERNVLLFTTDDENHCPMLEEFRDFVNS